MTSLWKKNLLAVTSVFCFSCGMPVKYQRPVVAAPQAFRELAGSEQWKIAAPNDDQFKGKWWEIFGDARLNALEETISVSNFDVKRVEAQFRQARALIGVSQADFYPSVGVSPSINQSDRGSNNGGGRPSASFSGTVTASWVPDIWGRVHLAVENAVNTAQLSAATLENVRLSIQAELAADYFAVQANDMQSDLLRDTIDLYQTYLKLTNDRFTGGVASLVDVRLAETQLYNAQAQYAELGVVRHQLEHVIAVLTGVPPGEFTLAPSRIAGPPPPIPVGVPSRLLERRPDIAAQERSVIAANNNIGFAKLAFFPSFALSGSVGLSSGSLLNLLSWGSRVWSAGPSLAQTLFDSGKRHATQRATEANYDATVAAYRQTTLNAMQQVEDSLSTLRILAEEATIQQKAVDAALASLNLETERYRAGTDTYLNVITTQQITLASQRNSVTLLQRRMNAAVNLILALGGGWDVSALPTPEQIKSDVFASPASTQNVAQPPVR